MEIKRTVMLITARVDVRLLVHKILLLLKRLTEVQKVLSLCVQSTWKISKQLDSETLGLSSQ